MFSLNRKPRNRHDSADVFRQSGDVPRIAIAEDGRIVYASPAFCALSHMDEEQMRRMELGAVLSLGGDETGASALSEGTHKIRINGNDETLEFSFDWLEAADNRRYLVGSQIMPAARSPLRLFQERILRPRAAEQSLNAAAIEENDLHHFTALSHDLMAVTDLKGRILRADENLQKSGVQNFADLFGAEDRQAAQGTASFTARLALAGGTERWLEWRSMRKGNLIYRLGRDVSAIKTQESALSRREKQLIEAESIGRMGHWSWTIGQEDFEWSDEIYRIFGLSRESFIPTFESLGNMVHKSDISRVNKAFQRAVIEENDYDMEFRINRPDGETRYIRCEGRCAADETGEIIALYGIMQDMTERMLYERELREAKDAAERAYAAKSQFLANMSHELRTPLNAIIGFSEMMQRQLLGPIGTDKYLEYIGGIRESGEHLLDLISDILDMSKIEAGKYELDLEEISITKIMRSALQMIESKALESRIKIITGTLPPETLRIIADRRAVLQIILNVLSNAVKFTPEGGQVRVNCEQRKENIVITIADTGIGIPPNKLANITRPFEQVSSHYTRSHEGSGLGLAITKELTEMHGGALMIESELNVGTTVTVRLPLDADKHLQDA